MNKRFRNNLSTILKNKRISYSKLSKETGISRQTISKIINNEFYAMNVHTLVTLLDYLEVGINEFGVVDSELDFIDNQIHKMAFNKKNLAILVNSLSSKTKLSFTFHPYASNHCLNVDSKKYSNKYDFSGNIRIHGTKKETALEVIDFDLWKISKIVSYEEFYDLYRSLIIAFEDYAEKLRFNKIIFNVSSYYAPELQAVLFPRHLTSKDLRELVQSFPYDCRKNELLKFSVLKTCGYGFISVNEEEELLINEINNQVDSMANVSIFEKEKIRMDLMDKNVLERYYHVKKYFKYIY
ncbi:helix-turn-helix domain-containing protein [Enterococcus mundtii]|uniref:HTH cro/C1-type domain-containing protein n=1 Tax=Enterococcus mundtii TaxID=53346 RepID=A0A2T5DA98_ENTMU|nr:helix-turn-helix transcriptional regulator [Enterococcus mundtii]PTO34531.1 hypothetical protein C6N14_11730 [Enterococcus mundtii]